MRHTHGTRGVTTAIEGGMGGLPGTAGINTGDSGVDNCEETESSNNAEEEEVISHFQSVSALPLESNEILRRLSYNNANGRGKERKGKGDAVGRMGSGRKIGYLKGENRGLKMV